MDKHVSKIGISVFFPCYNDAGSIGKLIDDAVITLKKITNNFEVIVINDGSKDNSGEVLKKYAQKYSKLKLVTHKKNRGYGGALQSGFKASSKELIFYTDGDGQYDVRELHLLFGLMTKDVHFVNGIKMARHDPTYRIILGNLYNLVARWMFWLPVYDVDCDFRLIRKSIIDKITLTRKSGSICVELVKKSQKAGAIFRQVSVHHYERQWGKSQFFQPSRLLSTFYEFITLWWKLVIANRRVKK